MHSPSNHNDEIVCHCLGVTRTDIENASNIHGAETVRDVAGVTGAGDGCMSCRRKILAMLATRQTAAKVPG